LAHLPPKLRWLAFIGLACLALAIRLPRLGERPMHTDEAVNGYITGQLLAGEAYQYDPKDRHGPALYALALPLAKISGARNLAELTEPMLRLGPVLVGAATVLGFGLLANQLGFGVAFIAALLFAIGPLPVYYSRYFIHETLFVGATLGLMWAGGQLMSLWQRANGGFTPAENISRRPFVLAGCRIGMFAALMLACKETAVLHFAAFGAAGAWFVFGPRRKQGNSILPSGAGSSLALAGIFAAAAFVVVLIAFYSWGGTHWQGIGDLFRSIPHLASRASGEGHEKSFWYYFKLLTSGRADVTVLVLAPMGLLVGLSRFKSQVLVVYTIAICALYSAIPYKTPWLALNLWLPLCICIGYAVANWWRMPRTPFGRGVFIATACTVVVMLSRDTRLWAFAKPADENNPLAYAHTVEDLLRLPERVGELAKKNPGKDFRVAVVAADPWPLPWYLRKFSQTGFWQPGKDPGAADVYITSPEAAEQLASRLENRRPEYFGVRPEVLIILWPPAETGSP
jgi:uncharacterized protein (TIGR03663 family)